MWANVSQWASVVSSVATAVVATVAIIAIFQTRRALSETRHALSETRQQRLDQLKPIVSVNYEAPRMTLVLRNIGVGPAFNVECYTWCYEAKEVAPPWPSNLPWSPGNLAVGDEVKIQLGRFTPADLGEPGSWPAVVNYQDVHGRSFHTLYRAPGDVESQPQWKVAPGHLTLAQAAHEVEVMAQQGDPD